MHATQEIVDTEIGHEDGEEGGSHIDVINQRSLEHRQRLRVHHHGIAHECDERPGFLRVP